MQLNPQETKKWHQLRQKHLASRRRTWKKYPETKQTNQKNWIKQPESLTMRNAYVQVSRVSACMRCCLCVMARWGVCEAFSHVSQHPVIFRRQSETPLTRCVIKRVGNNDGLSIWFFSYQDVSHFTFVCVRTFSFFPRLLSPFAHSPRSSSFSFFSLKHGWLLCSFPPSLSTPLPLSLLSHPYPFHIRPPVGWMWWLCRDW